MRIPLSPTPQSNVTAPRKTKGMSKPPRVAQPTFREPTEQQHCETKSPRTPRTNLPHPTFLEPTKQHQCTPVIPSVSIPPRFRITLSWNPPDRIIAQRKYAAFPTSLRYAFYFPQTHDQESTPVCNLVKCLRCMSVYFSTMESYTTCVQAVKHSPVRQKALTCIEECAAHAYGSYEHNFRHLDPWN